MMKLKSFDTILDKIQPQGNTAIEKFFDINYSISKFLVDYRVDNEMTQKQLAEKLNVSQVMISKYENGDYNFTLKKICEISEFLDAKLTFDITLDEDDSKLEVDWKIGKQKWEDKWQCLIA